MASPDPDLRTLAAEAIALALNGPASDGRGWYRTASEREDLHRQADAVLAAVLPEHRRTVLTEAASLLDDVRAERHDLIGQILDAAAEGIRRLAAAAPPAGLSAPVPAENAPAVPEEAPARRRTTVADRTDDLREALYFALSGDYEIESADYRRAAGLLAHLGWVPLADVLDALRDEGAYSDWLIRSGIGRWYSIPAKDRDQLCRYLAERFATTAPEGADERNGHG